VSKHFVGLGLSTTSWSNKHQTMTNLDGVEKLDYLVEEGRSWLEFMICTRLFDLDHEVSVVNLRLFNTWEQILNDVFKKWEIVFQEFRYVNVS
jgi:flagellar biosynthesis component FlhA